MGYRSGQALGGVAEAASAAAARAAVRVLLAEDDAMVRPLLLTWLAESGMAVTGAPDGLAAMRLIEGESGERFDVLVTDLRMPGLDGIAVGECWRRRFPDRPLIYVTGFVQDLFPNGIVRERTALLAKPFRFAALLDLILRLVAGAPVAMGAVEREALSRTLAGAAACQPNGAAHAMVPCPAHKRPAHEVAVACSSP